MEIDCPLDLGGRQIVSFGYYRTSFAGPIYDVQSELGPLGSGSDQDVNGRC